MAVPASKEELDQHAHLGVPRADLELGWMHPVLSQARYSALTVQAHSLQTPLDLIVAHHLSEPHLTLAALEA